MRKNVLHEKRGQERTSMVDLGLHQPHPINNNRFLKMSCFIVVDVVCFSQF